MIINTLVWKYTVLDNLQNKSVIHSAATDMTDHSVSNVNSDTNKSKQDNQKSKLEIGMEECSPGDSRYFQPAVYFVTT